MVKGVDVAEVARTWVGVPFLHQGRTRHGVDCVGLLICVAHELGIVPRTFERRDYGRMPSREELARRIQSHCDQIQMAVPGSVLAIRWNVELAHVGIYTGSTIVHAYERIGRVVEHGYRGRWVSLTDSVWMIRGVSYE